MSAQPCEPREVGQLLQAWIGLKVEEVDSLVDGARAKADQIPSWHQLVDFVGEFAIRIRALEGEVASLRKELHRLERRERGS